MLSTKQVLLHRITQERGTVFQSIAFLPEEQLTRRPLIGEWSAKDILGHLTAWEEEITRGIEQFRRGEQPQLLDIADVDAWNADQAHRRRDASLAQVKDEMIAVRRRLLDLVSSLPDEAFAQSGPPPALDPFVPAMLNAIADHDREHWAGLMACKEQWIAKQRDAR
jgi:hypothetical protein